MQISTRNEWDVIVVGGGPAGSTAATTLAQAGRRVLVLEKARFPRFHIGESLLPYNRKVFEELGVWEKIAAAGFTRKRAAQFVLGNGTRANRLDFSTIRTRMPGFFRSSKMAVAAPERAPPITMTS